jgi:integrase
MLLRDDIQHAIMKATQPRRYADGGALFLSVKGGGRPAHWTYRTRYRGWPVEIVLGTATVKEADGKLTVKQARDMRDRLRIQVKDGTIDPKLLPTPRGVVSKTKAVAAGVIVAAGPRAGTAVANGELFRDAVTKYLEEPGHDWKEAARKQNTRYLRVTAAPLADMKCTDIAPADVLAVLRLVWNGPSTAPGCRVRGLIERALAGAHVRRKKPGDPAYDNPAKWEGNLDRSGLSSKDPEKKPLPAMHHDRVPAFVKAVNDPVLSFIVLTASRIGEVIGDEDGKDALDWREIDMDQKMWTVPASRMKNKKPHLVPLSTAALAILEARGPKSEGRVFNGLFKHHKHRMTKSMRGQPSTTYGKRATLHGFRSSFTTWTEATGRSERIAQLCLSHRKKNEADQPMDPVSLAYARHDYIEERATLLQDWSDYLAA